MQSQAIQKNDIDGLQGELEAARAECNNFVYAVSHDFATPLRAITSFSRLLKKEYEGAMDEKCRRYLEFVLAGGEKAQAMLQGLLKYSRLHTQSKAREAVQISKLVDKCRAALKDKLVRCKGSIDVRGALPVVAADSDQFFQLFTALIDNALTYCRPDIPPQLTISAEEYDSYWKCMVEDNGIGISPGNSVRIFELFKRLHTDEEYPGVGIGLTVCKRIVEYHGGNIGVTPAHDGGSIFWFTFPKTQEEVRLG